MASSLFRNEVIEARRDRLSGSVVAAVPPRSGAYAIVLGVAGLVFLLVALFGQFTSRTHVTGVVTYNRGFARIYPPQVATIAAIHVREGQIVAAGAPLVTLVMAQGRDQSGDGLNGQLGEFARQDAELARQQTLANAQGSSEDLWLDQQRSSLTGQIASLERQRDIAAANARLADIEAQRLGRLAAQGAASRRQGEEAHALALARHADVEALGERILAQQQALHGVEGQISQRTLATRQSLSQLEAQRAGLAAQRAAVLRQNQLVLTAPIAGRGCGDGGSRRQRA